MDPRTIKTLHDVDDPKKTERLAKDMRERGWIGRPVVAYGYEPQGDCRALTATHRIAAAIKAGLSTVPVYWLECPDDWSEEQQQDAWDNIRNANDQDEMLDAIAAIDPDAARIYAQEPGI